MTELDFEIDVFEADAVRILSVVEAFEVASPEDDAKLAELDRECKDRLKQIDLAFDPHKARAHSAWKALCESHRKQAEPYERIRAIAKAKQVAYYREQERLRLEEQQRLEAEARKAEQERRAAELAEIKRQAAEEAKAAATKAEAERIKREAADAAKALKATPIVIAPVSVPAAPKVTGRAFRKSYKARVINEALIPRKYMIPDMKAIQGVVTALGPEARIPGVEVYEENTVAVR